MALLVYSFLPVLASALVLPDSSMIHVFEHFEERSVVRQVASIPSYAIDYGSSSMRPALNIFWLM